MAYSGQTWFNEMHSPPMEGIYYVLDHALSGCVGVGVFVFFVMVSVLSSKMISLYVWEGHKLELLWTIIPGVILLGLAIPSLHLLYLMGQFTDPELDVKVTGRQWYWDYEVMGLEYSSYLKPTSDLVAGESRMFEVDNPLIVPYSIGVRFLVTSADVIHSWAVPSLGVKVDAVPGRINQVPMLVKRPGIFYGQCSELCGVHHMHMPVVVEAISAMDFIKCKGENA